MKPSTQLPLSVQLHPPTSLDSFWPGGNAEIVAALRGLAHDGGAVFIYGRAGFGKTHLLQGLVREASACSRHAAYLDLEAHRREDPDVLDGFSDLDVVALDNAASAFLQTSWTLALLRLSDELRSRGRAIAISAPAPPERCEGVLPDLASRLSAFTVFGLRQLLDGERCALLRDRAKRLGLEMSEDIAALIVTRCDRSIPELLALVDRLDRAALAAQRRLTSPFVRKTLEL